MTEIRPFDSKDTKKIIQFAIEGMDFQRYTKNPLFLKLYGYYFWYLEWSNCTEMIAAYDGDELEGVLISDFKGAPKIHRSPWRKTYVRIMDWILETFFAGGQDLYNETNKAMFDHLQSIHPSEGEIRFLAVNPKSKGKGTGTLLLNELKKKHPGKRIHLYTDDGCTYQFYDRKGFERVGDEQIRMDFGTGEIPVRCFLYTTVL